MSELDSSVAAWAASAALVGVGALAFAYLWPLALRKSGPRSQPVSMARLFLRIAMPLYIMYVPK